MLDGFREGLGSGGQEHLIQVGSIYCNCSVSTLITLDGKRCTRCKLIKTREEFYFRAIVADKMSSHCRECDKAACRERYAKDRRKKGKNPRAYTGNGRRGNKSETEWKMVNMYRSARKRSKTKGRFFDIELKDVFDLYVEKCPVFDIELCWKPDGTKRALENSPSLDRIDSSKGYVKGNIWIISWKANRIKNDGSAEDHMAIAQSLMNR